MKEDRLIYQVLFWGLIFVLALVYVGWVLK